MHARWCRMDLFAAVLLRVVPLLPGTLAGCGTSPPPDFYTLSPASGPQKPPAQAAYNIAVGPVSLPAIVDRPQIVLNTGPNRVSLAEQSRWAEPLKESIPRVMASDIALLLPDAYVSSYPEVALTNPDYRVLVDIQRFEFAQGEGATLDLIWSVTVERDGTRTTGRTFVREPVREPGYPALVAAHGRALSIASRDIAAAVKKIKKQH